MTSFWCFSINGFRAWFAGADAFFCMKPFYSTNHVLSVQGSRFEVQSSTFSLRHPPCSLLHLRYAPHTNAHQQVRLRLCRAVLIAPLRLNGASYNRIITA
jgi:hypothetical protein